MILNYSPIFSIILSLMIVNGFYNLAYKASFLTRNLIIKDVLFATIINFCVIVNLFAFLTFFTLLYFKINIEIYKLSSILIILFGFYKPAYLKFFKFIFLKKTIKLNLIYLILFFYFLLSLSPISDPDSLDYHITVPLYILNFFDHPFHKYWLTSQLSGSGETFLLYGLSLGAINFSQILQFISLFLIIIFILNFNLNEKNTDNEKKYYVSLCILLMPVFIFLVSTSKPQLFPILTNFVCLVLALNYLPNFNKRKSSICSFIIFLLLFCSTQMKFSFLLSSFLITLLVFFEMYKKKLLINSILISVILFFLIMFPREFYEFKNLNSNFLYNLINPVTDNFSSIDFNTSLKHGPGNSPFIPSWIFFPYPNFSTITYSLGISVLYFLFNLRLNKLIIKQIFFISFVFIILSLIFAQPVGRFFIEPFLWLLFASLLYKSNTKSKFQKIFEKLIIISSILFVTVIGYFSISFFKGNFGEKFYNYVLEKNADGYLLYKWANDVLPDDAVIITTHRSIAFYKHRAISYEFRLFTNSFKEKGFKYYMDNILKEKPSYILYSSTELNNSRDILKNCRGKLFKHKKNVGHTAGRSPFHKKTFYDGYIYHVDLQKLKECKI